MTRALFNGLVFALVLTGGMAQSASDPLGRARAAYNTGKFDDAITAATEAMKTASQANAAAIVLGRSYLERYRASRTASDLDDARAALKNVAPDLLTPRDRIQYLVGLGESLYLEGCARGCFGAAAEVFELALAQSEPGPDREPVFEWWASSLDQQAQYSPESSYLIYRRLLDGATAELAKDDRSASATYWVMAAARGTGDLDRSWAAAIAGWVRSRGFGKRGETLRADIDRFVTQALLPERARQSSPDTDARPALAMFVGQWEEIKRKF